MEDKTWESEVIKNLENYQLTNQQLNKAISLIENLAANYSKVLDTTNKVLNEIKELEIKKS